MSLLPPPRLYNPTKDSHLLRQIAQIHADCITHDGQLATFLPPLDVGGKMVEYWKRISQDVSDDKIVMILQIAPTSSNDDDDRVAEEVAGYVCLLLPVSETGPFRGIVEKLMVSTRHRRKGVATRVMGMLQDVARERGRELLMLDTTIGLPADDVYPKLGWIEYGVIRKYGISPVDRRLVDERIFYKDLRDLTRS